MGGVNEFWVIVEQVDGAVKPVTYEVLNAAKTLAGKTGGTVVALYLASDAGAGADSLTQHGADRVLVLKHPSLARYTCSGYLAAIASRVWENPPSAILLGATNHGKELAPALSAKFNAGLATDCIALEIGGDGGLRVRRPVYAGKAISTVTFANGVLPIVTLRPNVFRSAGGVPAPSSGSGAAETRDVELPESSFMTKITEVAKEAGKTLDITEARILVSGGLGMQNAGNFNLLEELAEVLGGTVGASRPVVDSGWRKYSNQVGQTGRTVSPDLYIACGISGAVQHLAGMSSSKCIVAINKDPNAPIFSVADYGIVGDVLRIVPLLTQEFRRVLQK